MRNCVTVNIMVVINNSITYRKLPDELIKKAKNEINEDPNRIDSDLEQIKNWLQKQPHINARYDDQWLLAFLRGCKFSLERTKEKLDMYYTMKTLIPEFYENRDVTHDDIRYAMNNGVFLPLYTKNSPNLPRYVILRIGAYNPDKLSFSQALKANMILVEIGLMEDDYAPVNGIVVIIDMKGMTLAHVASPIMIKKAVMCLQETYPHRIKGVHFINTPAFFDSFFMIVRPLLTEKIKKRIQVHGSDLKSLIKATSKETLPKEYGGEADDMKMVIDKCFQLLDKYKQWFIDDAQYKTDESKRPSGKAKTVDETFGIEGSFRKLDFD